MTQLEWKKRFRERLIVILKDQNMSQSQLAKHAGLSVSRISDYMNMKVMPSVFAIVNIAYSLNVPMRDLIDFNERIRN